MNFDPNPMPEWNATPECEEFWQESTRLSERLERRARIAEEKLERYRRAVQILKLTFENQGLFDAAKATQEKIEEIESVGK